MKNLKKKGFWKQIVKKALPVLLVLTMVGALSACDLPDFFVSCNGDLTPYEVVIPETKRQAVSQVKKMIRSLKKDNFTYEFVDIGVSNAQGKTVTQTIRRDGNLISTEHSNGDARGVLDIENSTTYRYVSWKENWFSFPASSDDYVYEAFEIINEVPGALSLLSWKTYDNETKTLTGKWNGNVLDLRFTDEGADLIANEKEFKISDIGTTEVGIPNVNSVTSYREDENKSKDAGIGTKQTAYIQENER